MHPRFVIFMQALVLHVPHASHAPKVINAIIRPVVVDVVDLIRWPLVMNHRPNDPVGLHSSVKHYSNSVAMPVIRS